MEEGRTRVGGLRFRRDRQREGGPDTVQPFLKGKLLVLQGPRIALDWNAQTRASTSGPWAPFGIGWAGKLKPRLQTGQLPPALSCLTLALSLEPQKEPAVLLIKSIKITTGL